MNYVLRPDWRYKKSNEKYPFRLWVTYLDQRKDYLTKLEISKSDYNKLTARNINGESKDLRLLLKKISTGIENYLSEITEFEFEAFQKSFISYHPLFVQRIKKITYRKTQELIFDYKPYEKRFPILLETHLREESISVLFQHIIKAKLRNAHRAAESHINMPEHHGLNRCMDKGLHGFKRYAGLSVLSYNLHILGNGLKGKKLAEDQRKEKRRLRLAA